jgi:hypothetical protein
MGFKVHYKNPEERVTMEFMDRDYELLNPKQFMLETFAMEKYPTSHHEITVGIIVGTMSVGKSNTIRYFADIARQIYGERLNCMYVKDIAAGIEAAIKHPKYIQFLAIDDAVTKGMDSRRSMSSANVSLSERFYMIRHELEDAYPAGFSIIILGTQDYEAIDRRIRKNAQFTIFKNYYEEVEYLLNFEMEYIEFLKQVTDEALRKHNPYARSFGIGFTQIQDLVKLYIPEVKPEEVPFIKEVTIIEKKKRIKEQLIQEIIKKGVLEGGVGAGHGYILKRLSELDSLKFITLSNTDRTEILYLARYFSTSGDYVFEEKKNETIEELKDLLIETGMCKQQKSVIRGYIRKVLKSKKMNPELLSEKEIKNLIEDALYEYFNKESVVEEKNGSYATNPQDLTISEAIKIWLNLNGKGTPKTIHGGISKVIERNYGSVKAELSRNDEFVAIGNAFYALKGSIFDTVNYDGPKSKIPQEED